AAVLPPGPRHPGGAGAPAGRARLLPRDPAQDRGPRGARAPGSRDRGGTRSGGGVIRVCSLSDLDDRKPVAFEVGDEYTPVVLVRDGEGVHALHGLCSHAAIELSEGEVTRKGIECYLHGSCFDLRTGEPSSPP